MNLFPWFLFAHVLGAIIAFGPTFSFAIIGRMGGAEPMHANFATRLSEHISKVQVTPLAIFQGITGLGLIITRSVDVFKTTWLLIGIVLYLIAISYAIFIQGPTVKKVIEMTTPPAGGGAPGGPPMGGAPMGGAPMGGAPAGGPPAGGPPPALMALIGRVQRGGMLLAALIVTIVFLMVVKPTF